jgi:hypothetical protein
MVSRLALLFTVVLLSVALSPNMAQDTACQPLVKQALTAIGDYCASLPNNTACYGHRRIDTTFAEPQPDEFFTQAADRSELTMINTLETASLNVEDDTWGVAVMNMQANVPETLPGQAVTFILLGETEIQNAVRPDEAVLPTTHVTMTTNVKAYLRSRPSLNASAITVVEGGTPLEADAVSEDGHWFRVIHDDMAGWVNYQVVDAPPETKSLTAIGDETRAPMQAFYLLKAFPAAKCTDAPPSVAVMQGPRSVHVDFTINEADITIGSTVVFQLLDENTLQLAVLDGEARTENLIVGAGFKTIISLGRDEDRNVLAVNGRWHECRRLTDEDRAALRPLENIPANLLHYPIRIPEKGSGFCVRRAQDGEAVAPLPGLISTPVPGSQEAILQDGQLSPGSVGLILQDGLPGACGDLKCDSYVGESCLSCPTDCGKCPLIPLPPKCGNGVCEKGEDENSCPKDCVAIPK